MTLTKEQKRVLLHKHMTGEFPGQLWRTIQNLIDKGLLTTEGMNLIVTPAGKQYCDNNHSNM